MVSLLTRLRSYAEPLFLLCISILFFPITLVTHPFLILTSPSTFRSKWFENFWKVIGPKMAASPQQVDHIENLLSRAQGVCLELGPGAGDQSYHFKAQQITMMYGAEPNVFLHEKLLVNAQNAGLGSEKYEVLECGAEPNTLLPALKKANVLPPKSQSLPPEGVFDTVIAVKSLCSAPQSQMQATMAIIHALLKPGGEFLFFEHLQNENDTLTRSFVWVVNLIWPYIMGGCHMNAKLDKVLTNMGGWADRDLKTIGEHQGHEPFRVPLSYCSSCKREYLWAEIKAARASSFVMTASTLPLLILVFSSSQSWRAFSPACRNMLTGPNVARHILSTRLRCVRRFSVAPVCAKKSDPLPSHPTLPDHDLVHTAVKGSGPGGQKINKTSSAIQMTHLPTGIVVKSQATRSRSQNYTIARRILAEKVDFLEKGDDSRVAKKAERAAKKKASADKKKRRKYRQLSRTQNQDLTSLRQRKDDATEAQSPSSDHSAAK